MATQVSAIKAGFLRLVRVAVAMGLPVLISWLAGSPDVRWAALAPVITSIAKYLRDTFPALNWIPV